MSYSLQQHALNRGTLTQLLSERGPIRWQTMSELERLADEFIFDLRVRRRELARHNGFMSGLIERLDRWILTDREELIDGPLLSDAVKTRLVERLHRQNKALGAYRRFLGLMTPTISALHRKLERPVRVLELAGGSGEFSLELAGLAERRGLPVQIRGSDIVAAYVHQANRKARARGLGVRFEVVNAFDLSSGALPFDLAFIAQSLHHFSPGQIAMMMAQTRVAGGRAFVGVDGHRSLSMVALVPAFAVGFGRSLLLARDALVSARKFYPVAELEAIGQLALPGADVEARAAGPGYSVVRARWNVVEA